jgi:hypothetical protein
MTQLILFIRRYFLRKNREFSCTGEMILARWTPFRKVVGGG